MNERPRSRRGADPVAPEDVEELNEQPLEAVMGEVRRLQARALILEHAAQTLLTNFAADGDKSPRLLLQVPGGGAFAADVDDLFELQQELLALAGRERTRVRQLLCSVVAVPTRAAAWAPVVPSDPRESVVLPTKPRSRPKNDEWDEFSKASGDPPEPVSKQG